MSQGSQVTRNRVQVENRTHLISTGDKTKYFKLRQYDAVLQ